MEDGAGNTIVTARPVEVGAALDLPPVKTGGGDLIHVGEERKVGYDGVQEIKIKINAPPTAPKYDYDGIWYSCGCSGWIFATSASGGFPLDGRVVRGPGGHPALRTCVHLCQTFGI